mmetsp:Transcript_23441/g.48934  ORF Transcript_23441/g.48934 Transcript_23441/m.48934 type:complete len:120 (-) Transcript_23441:137-496(-)
MPVGLVVLPWSNESASNRREHVRMYWRGQLPRPWSVRKALRRCLGEAREGEKCDEGGIEAVVSFWRHSVVEIAAAAAMASIEWLNSTDERRTSAIWILAVEQQQSRVKEELKIRRMGAQ